MIDAVPHMQVATKVKLSKMSTNFQDLKVVQSIFLYVFWELNESLRKIVFRHKKNGLCMRRSNPIVIDCYMSLDWCILEVQQKGHSSQFHELFLME